MKKVILFQRGLTSILVVVMMLTIMPLASWAAGFTAGVSSVSVQATVNTDNSINVRWNPIDGTDVNYAVYYISQNKATGVFSEWGIASVSNGSEYQIAILASNATYYITVLPYINVPSRQYGQFSPYAKIATTTVPELVTIKLGDLKVAKTGGKKVVPFGDVMEVGGNYMFDAYGINSELSDGRNSNGFNDYNLDKKFTSIKGDLFLIDTISGWRSNGWVKFYGDGVLLDEIEVPANDKAVHFEVPLTNVGTFKIAFIKGYMQDVGIGNVSLTKWQ